MTSSKPAPTTGASDDVLSGILQQAREQPGRPAVRDTRRELDYGALAAEVSQVARGLAARGVTAGDRVALIVPNSADFVVAALASLWLGAIFVPLSVTDPDARLALTLDDCSPVIVLLAGERGMSPVDYPSLGRFQLASVAVLASEGRSPDRRRHRQVAGASGAGPGGGGVAPAHDVGDDLPKAVTTGAVQADAAYAVYTSGTTGVPKGVLVGNGAFRAAIINTVDALGLDRGTRSLCVSPIHFDGAFLTIFPTLCAGGTVVIQPRDEVLHPRKFISTVASERITYTGFSPTYLRMLLRSRGFGRLATSELRIIALGGEAPSLADVRAVWESAPELEVWNRYGPTETAIAVTHVKLTPELTAGGVIPFGTPHAGVEFHLLDGDGRPVEAPGEVGELYIGGGQLMIGYWNAPELTSEVMRTDVVPGRRVYRTGDLVYRDIGGNYVYVGRADRVVKRHGLRLSLVELGEAICRVRGVSAAACVAFDHEGTLGIAAFVVRDGDLGATDIRNAARQWLADEMLPDRIELVDEFPLTSSSKLDEPGLLAGAGLRPVRAAAPPHPAR